MKNSNSISICKQAFDYLVDVYGFSGPEIENLGAETYVTYTKGNKTVSIVFEYDNLPLIELYHSVPEGQDRQIPNLKKKGVDYSKFRYQSEEDMTQYLALEAEQLRKQEIGFISS